MFAVEFRFPAGRFHATPWGRHVNEGVPEWPPSPWRFLRALIALAHRNGMAEEGAFRRFIEKLAADLPSYRVPPASAAHTRHYMPLFRPDDMPPKVFDTFVAVAKDAPLVMAWSATILDQDETRMAAFLLSRLSYLGRTESWVEAKVIDGWDGECNVYPANGVHADEGMERIPLACPSPAGLASLATRLEEAPAASRGRRKPRLQVPADIFEALHADTGEILKQGWNRAPGLAWVDYLRPSDCLSVVYQPRPGRSADGDFTTARFALSSAVLPHVANTIGIAERVRVALLKWSNSAPEFLGREGDLPSRDPRHRHAFFLPEDADGDGFLDHIVIHAAGGFSNQAINAMSRISKLWGAGGHHIFLAFLGVGTAEEFGGPYPEQTPLLLQADTWESVTPYIPAGHLKVKKMNRRDPAALLAALEREVRRELSKRGQPLPARVEYAPWPRIRGRKMSWLTFRTQRKKGGGQRGDNGCFGLRLIFDRPVSGPLAIGYGAHFGLGLFRGVY